MIRSINDVLELDKNEQGVYSENLGDKVELILKNKVKEIHIDQENDKFDGAYSEIIMNTDSSTLISLIVKNGQIICIDKDATYFELLEKE